MQVGEFLGIWVSGTKKRFVGRVVPSVRLKAACWNELFRKSRRALSSDTVWPKGQKMGGTDGEVSAKKHRISRVVWLPRVKGNRGVPNEDAGDLRFRAWQIERKAPQNLTQI